ncbi:MAG: hypothetical protein AW08_02920 [Candidatus Accumulibacter adjunctus]|uniref:DUF4062 domain-containing protein n=1 Tax=Candidatus Accumulibacter adjunctus TaxID=1454001 RepID=A0A011NMN1_9PROT|nr:MAG: hypothetical protein AW08_02920 [Candidatus Accumulibacter adjunctus]
MSTTAITTRRIFLASSAELADHRRDFENAIRRRNDLWIDQGVYLRLTIWEDFLDALSKSRLQDEYNREIRQCDVFVMLYRSKVGRYTEEEFATAVGQFQATSKPFIYTYFCDSPDDRAAASAEDLQSLHSFQEKLRALGHFQTVYGNTDQLCRHFGEQLDKLAANGFVKFERDREPSDGMADHSRHAVLHGNGAIAQGDGPALGAGSVFIAGNHHGPIDTGTRVDTGGGAYVGGNISAGGDFVGRDRIVTQGVPASEIGALFAPLFNAVSEHAAPRNQAEAQQRLAEIEAEVAKGRQADDSRLGRLLDGLAALVPGAVASLVGTFASPLLAAAVGPVTKFVLGKLQAP